MKLKKNVCLDTDTMTLVLDKKTKIADSKDYPILHALNRGVSDDDHFLRLVMHEEQIDEIEAGFRMAYFVEEYSDFLEKEKNSVMLYQENFKNPLDK